MQEIDLELHIEQIQTRGFTVVPAMLDEAECELAQHALDRLAAVRDRGGLELIFNKEAVFEGLYRKAPLLALVRYFLGADALLSSMTGSVLAPGQGKGGLHADGALTGHNRSQSMSQDDGGDRITSHVIGLNTIWCICDFTAINGSTQLVPGSHLQAGLEIPEDALEQAVIVEAPRGSVIVFNVNTWHGPSHNQTAQNRYAVLNPWRRHWTRCEYAMVDVVKPEVVERAGEERLIFGLDAEPPYVERWQWDREHGRPTAEFQHLKRGRDV